MRRSYLGVLLSFWQSSWSIEIGVAFELWVVGAPANGFLNCGFWPIGPGSPPTIEVQILKVKAKKQYSKKVSLWVSSKILPYRLVKKTHYYNIISKATLNKKEWLFYSYLLLDLSRWRSSTIWRINALIGKHHYLKRQSLAPFPCSWEITHNKWIFVHFLFSEWMASRKIVTIGECTELQK